VSLSQALRCMGEWRCLDYCAGEGFEANPLFM
jgi:hypothetical protein